MWPALKAHLERWSGNPEKASVIKKIPGDGLKGKESLS